ncbi:MAG: ATP-dependent DNA helicase [Candidatus Gracilibacteria bacterium]|nr:ATP-dependent DNA helicase [Candidatus Gracilibacteria bacterium]MDD2909264.1 ATP-dependent DNA helicase [Candidatus Gracilibacteria bacterium]
MNTEQNFLESLASLNSEQKLAVESIYGPVMVVAGPGTGKTQIMALRAANIIIKTGTDPRNILITTFTEAGIISLKKRLFDFIGVDSYKINVSTIHSFCNDVISEFPEKFLEFRAFKTIDEIEQIEIFESIIESGNYEALSSEYEKFFYLKDIKSSISKLKQEGVDIHEFKVIIEKQKEIYSEELAEIKPTLKKYESTKEKQERHITKLAELNDIYAKYLKILNERGLYDFSDMIDFVLNKFKQDQNLRLHYAEKYQFIMVDEYQDTNNAQNEIVDLILGESDDKNILVVGDDDQSIYRFQGANLENMLYFSKKYENTKFVVLKENYRSTQGILDYSSILINNNKGRIVNYIPGLLKELHSNKTNNNKPKLFTCNNNIEEKAFILQEINKRISDGKNIEEIAIIVRTNGEVEAFTDFLQSNGIPVESKLKSNILKSKYVNLLLNLIEVVVDPSISETKLINVLRSPISGVNKLDILILLKKLSSANYKLTEKKKLFDLISDTSYLDSVSKEIQLQQSMFEETLETKFEQKISGGNEFREFTTKILECQGEISSNFYNFFKTIIEKFNFVEFVEKTGKFSDIEDIYTLLNYIKKLVELDREITPSNFFKKISYFYKYNLPIKRNIIKSGNIGVQVLTAHQSKGLEYNTVFIPGLTYGNWGSRRVVEKIKLPFGIIGSSITEEITGETENEEERRLFFVAMTRARNELILSFPFSQDNKVKLQSEFLQELGLPSEPVGEVNIENIVKNELKIANFDSIVSQEEELYIKEFLRTYKLSVSDLNKFIEDPRLFLRDTIFKYPFEDNKFTVFGKVYHKTLEYFYLEFKKSGSCPDKLFLEKNFVWLLKKEILSSEEYEELKEKGVEGLKGWYDNQVEFKLPIELEYDFRFRNVILDEVPLTGKVDKIELLRENEVCIVDYKTGKTRSLNEIKGNTANSDGKYFRQLLFYKIMFDLDINLNQKYDLKGLAIEYVEGKDGKYSFVNVDYTDEDIERVKDEIKEVWTKINDLEFWRRLI